MLWMRKFGGARRAATVVLAALCAVAVATLCAVAVGAGSAQAGEYHVYSCRTPGGQVAPTDGWTGSTSVSSATVVAKDTCPAGGSLIAALGDGVEHEVGTSATWTFSCRRPRRSKRMTRCGALASRRSCEAKTCYVSVRGPAEPTKYESCETYSECLYSLNCKTVGEPEEPLSSRNLLPVPMAISAPIST